jgi:hypothetical protein
MTRNPDIAGILAQHRLAPGPDGFALADLEAVVAAHGWRADVAERPLVRSGYHRTPHFAAVVFAPVAPAQALASPPRLLRGNGATAAAALAQALAKALAGRPLTTKRRVG